MLRSDRTSPVGLEAPAPSPLAQAPRPPLRWSTRLLALAAGIAVLAVLVLLRGHLGLFWIRVMTSVFMFATLTQAINLIAGYTGYPAFGNVVFFGLGGYAAGVAMVHYDLPFVAGLAIGAAGCAGIALLVGPAMLRLRGHYFAVGTLGLNEATRALVDNLRITGGGAGLSLPLFPGGIERSSSFFYVVFLLAATAMLVACWVLMRSRFGYACRAIRADEEAAVSLGVPTTRTKTLAWMVSAVAMALCGSIHAYWLSYLDPHSAFNMGIAIKFFLMMLVGGVGTLFGPIIGALFVELAATAVWSRLIDYHVGALGLIMIVVVVLFPGGFMQVIARRAAWLRPAARPRRT